MCGRILVPLYKMGYDVGWVLAKVKKEHVMCKEYKQYKYREGFNMLELSVRCSRKSVAELLLCMSHTC